MKLFPLFLATPIIVTQPEPQVSVMKGNSFSLICVAKCQPSPSYQWYFNGTPLINETSAKLSIDNADNMCHSGDYYCVATNHSINDKSSQSVMSRVSRVDVVKYPVPGECQELNNCNLLC